MKSKLFLFIFAFFLFCGYLRPEVNYKVSGKVVCEGKGIRDVVVNIVQNIGEDFGPLIEKNTDRNGEFHVYLKSGMYSISIDETPGYVVDTVKQSLDITVSNQKIENVVLIHEYSAEQIKIYNEEQE